MATRQIIEIDQDLCNGCGECATGCPEGALKIIDGKARLVGESLCDGLGACIGNCPLGAIKVITRDADAYDERLVMAGIVPQGPDVLRAHFEHLDHHGQDLYLREAVAYLRDHNLDIPAGFARFAAPKPVHAGCPGSLARTMARAAAAPAAPVAAAHTAPVATAPLAAAPSGTGPDRPSAPSALSQWPIQLHLANPRSGQFADADLLIAADCTAFSMGSFHQDLLQGKKLLIACPKLDSGREIYLDKLTTIMSTAKSVSLAIMEVPCCSGLAKLAMEARERAGRDIRIDTVVIGIEGGFVAKRSY